MDTASEIDEETKDSNSVDLYGEPAADLESVKNLEELNTEHAADRVLEDHDEPVANGHEVSGTVEVPGVTDSEAPISIDNDSTDGKSPVIQDVKTENLEQENTDPEVDRALDNATDEAKAAANDEEPVSVEETTTADGEHLQGITADVDGKVVEPEYTDGCDNISSEVSLNFDEQNLGDAETQPSTIEDFKDEKLHTVPATFVETPESLEEHNIIEDEANDAESNLDVPPEASVTIGEPIVADADTQILEAFKDAELAQVEQNSENTASEIGEETKGDSVMVEELSIADAEDPTSIIEDSKSVDLHKEPAADLESFKDLDELNNEHTADRALEDDNERTDIGQEVSGTVEEPDFSDSQETERIDKDSKDGKLHISPDVETEHLEQRNIEETTGADGEKSASEQITADVDEEAFELENKDGDVIEEKAEGDHLSAEDTVIIARDTDAVLQETATRIGSESLDGVVETLSSSDNNDEVADLTSNELVLADDAETFGVAQQKSQETTIQAQGVDKDLVEVFPVQNPNEVESIVVGKEADENEGAPPRNTVNVEQPSSGATKEQPVELQGTNEDDAANTVSVCDGLAVDEEILATSNNNQNNVAESRENEDEGKINIQVPAMDERSSIIDAQVKRESPVGSEATSVEQNEAEEQLPPEVAEVTLRNKDEEENKSDIKDESAVEADIAEAKVEIEGIAPEEPAETEVQMEAEDSSEVNDAMNELKGTLDGVFEAEAEHDAPESWDDSSNEPEKVEAAATGKSEEVQELQGHTEASEKAATLDESAVDNLLDDSSRAPEGNSDVPDVADRALEIEGESDSISGNNSENAEKISAEAGDVADVVYNGLVTEVPQDSVIAEGKATMEKVKESGDEKQDAELEDEHKAPPQIVQHLQEKAAPADDKEDESISVDNAGSKEEVPIETGPMDSRTEQTFQEIDDSKDEVPSSCGLEVVAAEQLVGDQPEEEKAESGTAEVDGGEHEKITVMEAGDNTTRVIEESEISSEPNGVTIGGSFGRETEGGSKISDESEGEIGIVSTGEEPVNQGIASENLEKAAVEESEQDTKGAEELLAVAAEASVPCAIAEAIDDYNGAEKSLLERALVKVEAGNESEEQRKKHEDVETGKTEEKHEGRESGRTEKENTDNLGTQPEPVEQAKVFTTANSIATTLKSIIAALSTKPSKKKRQRLRKELVKTQEQSA